MIQALSTLAAVVLTVAWLPLAFGVLYLLLLTSAAAFGRRPLGAARHTRSFRVVVPAHNEALVIESMLRRLLAVDYPRGKWEVLVVADNCTDETAHLARRAGARVLERTDLANRGKGHALACAFSMLQAEDFDAYVILDADTIVDAELLAVFNRYLEHGHRAIQGHYDVLNPWESHRTTLMYIALRIFNYVRPLGRRALGLSTGLQGNAMCFTKQLLDGNAWSAFSLAEDIEYTTKLVLNRERVTFAPEAKVWAQMPAGSGQARTQRLRWEGGRLAMARRDGPRLLATGLRHGDARMLDWAIDLLIPPLAALTLLILAGVAVSGGLALLGLAGMGGVFAAWLALVPALGVFVVAALAVGRMPRRSYLALANVPRYVLWKLWIYALLLLRSTPRSWVRTERTQIEDRGSGMTRL